MSTPSSSIALAMLSLVPGGMGGSETYARALATGLEAAGERVRVLLPENALGFTGVSDEFGVGGVVASASTAARLRALFAAFLRRRRIRSAYGASATVHFPFTVPVPRPRRDQAFVMTVHDVQHREMPELFGRAERVFRRFTYDRPARRADLVITISEYARTTLVRELRVDPARVRVVPLGVDTSSFEPELGERAPFALYPARGWPHKNHAALIEAITIVRQQRPGFGLVLTGGNLDALGTLPDWVDRRGLVPLAELRSLYRTAAVLAFPSRYEGFGLPPLEAMASGLPVAASRAGSIPEVVGDAAVLFDPDDPADIARGILEALERGPELTAAGLERVRRFTWEACIDGHRAAYADAAAFAARRRSRGGRRG
jgi:glycosyltransferase involved in cell wall biosynthesis